jgi:tetratricopeptide (TPR) repeat protein
VADRVDGLWERLAAGHLVGAVGDRLPSIPPWLDRDVVRVTCDDERDHGPLITAARQMAQLQPPRPVWSTAVGRTRGLRRRVFGEPEDDRTDGIFRAIADASGPRPVLLALDHVEDADEATLRLLLRAAHRRGSLPVPTLLLFSEVPGGGLAATLARTLGVEPVSNVGHDDPPAVVAISPPLRRTLRAAAWLGSPFHVGDVAALLGTTDVAVLLDLQAAADEGVAVQDDGDGTIQLDTGLIAALREGLLPSLAARWAARTTPDAEPGPPPDAATAALDAARDAWLAGQEDDAVAWLKDQEGDDQPRRDVRIATLADLAWFHHERGELFEARRYADLAVDALQDGDPVELVASLHALRAGIDYDIGADGTLKRALDDLTIAVRSWQEHGDAVSAARLLNDQAAVYVRLGDPVRGADLLRSSREVFAERAATDDVAKSELAETEHLLARLPLHVDARPGLEADALRAAVGHARRAEQLYRDAQRTRELARVWETLGRLESRSGRGGPAIQLLSEAVRVQREIGDELGLARTTGALSEALADGGRMHEAVSLLADSIALNIRTGSVRGLEYNQRALDALRGRGMSRPEVQRALDGLAARIDKARKDLEARAT